MPQHAELLPDEIRLAASPYFSLTISLILSELIEVSLIGKASWTYRAKLSRCGASGNFRVVDFSVMSEKDVPGFAIETRYEPPEEKSCCQRSEELGGNKQRNVRRANASKRVA